MHEADLLQVEISGPIAKVRLNLPDSLNPVSASMIAAISAEFRRLQAEQQVHIVILSGNGRAFCAGADRKSLERMGDASVEEIETALRNGQAMSRILFEADLIVITAVHGYCIGGGLSLVLASDICIAEENTVFFAPEVGHGLPYLWWSTPQMIATMGAHRAKFYAFTGQRFDARQAHQFGLVSATCSGEQLQAKALELAEHLSRQPWPALLTQKRLTNRVINQIMAFTEDEVSMAMAGVVNIQKTAGKGSV